MNRIFFVNPHATHFLIDKYTVGTLTFVCLKSLCRVSYLLSDE